MKENSCPMKKTSIGGQALIEGVMMRGPKRSAMTVRDPDGNLVIEEWENEVNHRPKFFKLPLVRGMFNFFDSLKGGYKCLMRSAEIAGLEEPEKGSDAAEGSAEGEAPREKKSSAFMNVIMVISTVLALILAVGMFVVLPAFLYDLLGKLVPWFSADKRFVRAVFEGLLRIVILVGYLALVTLMKDIRRTFQYHGAEHKTIFCYESGLELTVENVRTQRRFHPRCGTSFLIIMVLVGVIISMLIPTTLHTAFRVLIKLALLPIIMGVGYELIKLAGRRDNIITRIISAPGVWLQRITVLEPSDDMIECAIESMKRVIPEDGSDRW